MPQDFSTIAEKFLALVKTYVDNELISLFEDVLWALMGCVVEIVEKLAQGMPPAEGYILEKLNYVLRSFGIYARYRHVIFGDQLPFSLFDIEQNVGEEHVANEYEIPALVDFLRGKKTVRDLAETMKDEESSELKFDTYDFLCELLGEKVGSVALHYLRSWSCFFRQKRSGLVAKLVKSGVPRGNAERFVEAVASFCRE